MRDEYKEEEGGRRWEREGKGGGEGGGGETREWSLPCHKCERRVCSWPCSRLGWLFLESKASLMEVLTKQNVFI